MTDAEMIEFLAVFNRVRAVFPLRGEREELREVGVSYFHAMRRFPLRQVDTGADRCIQQLKRFPRPAEWIELIPRQEQMATVEVLTADAAAVWLEAERLRWDGPVCRCRACRLAGVDAQPTRFVPDLDANDRDVKVQIGDRTVTAGHWAHGDELAGYYRGKATFFTTFRKSLQQHTMGRTQPKGTVQQRIEAAFEKPVLVPDREPGEDDV